MAAHRKAAEGGNPAKPDSADDTGYNYADETAQMQYTTTYGSRNYISDDSIMDPDSGVKRGLKNRHLSMMALAGIIGPGLLVGAGGALNSGGPAALIIGFGVIGKTIRDPVI